MEPARKQDVLINGQPLHFREAVRVLTLAAGDARRDGALEDAARYLTVAANSLYEAGELEEALERMSVAEAAWRETFDLDKVAECLDMKATWQHKAKKSDAALETLREVETIDRQLGSMKLEITLEHQVKILYDLGRADDMRRVAAEFFRIARDAKAIWQIRRRLMHHGIDAGAEAAAAHPFDFGSALLDHAVSLQASDAKETQALLALATSRFQAQNFAEALAAATQACESKPDLWAAWWIQGQTLFSLRRYEECVASLSRALSLEDQNPTVWWMKGHALSYLGRFEEEVACCDRALVLKPDYVEAMSMKAAALIELNRYPEAVDCCARATGIDSSCVDAWMNLGVAHTRLKQFAAAAKAFGGAAALGHPRAAACVAISKEREEAERVAGNDATVAKKHRKKWWQFWT